MRRTAVEHRGLRMLIPSLATAAGIIFALPPTARAAEAPPDVSDPAEPAEDDAEEDEGVAEDETGAADAPRQDDDAEEATAEGAETGGTEESAETSDSTTSDSSEAAESQTAEGGTVVDSSGTGLFEASVSGAAPATEQGEPGEAIASRTFELNGYVRGDVFVGKVPGFSQGEIKAGYGELALQLKATGSSLGNAYAEARLRHGRQGEEQRLIVDLREAYVNAYLGPIDLRLGHQIIVWGRADGFNPTNNVTPLDLRVRSPVEDDRRLGNVGARAFWNLAPIRIEGVWMPLYAATEVPAVDYPSYVTLSEPNYPEPKLSKSLLAGRVHLELPSFEMSASYLRGYALMPGLALRGFGNATDEPPELLISRTAYRHHVVGFDFSTSVGDTLAVRAEAAYRQPPGYEEKVHAPRPDLQYVLGLDRAFGEISVIAQYVGRYVFDWQRDTGPENAPDLSEFTSFPESARDTAVPLINQELAARNQMLFQQTARVQHLASVRVEWLTLHDTLSLSALGLVNFTTKEWLAYPKVRYKLTDRMSTAVGGEIYVGPEGTLLGLIDEQLSAGYAELRYSF